MKLTSIGLAPSVNLNSLIHIVNPSDITQSPDGSSYKAPLSLVAPIFSNTYWSASTGTNGIVLSNSNSLASGQNSVAEGLNTTAGGYASKASGYNSKALGVTSFVHSTNSTINVGANRTVILGGQSITATQSDTVYVPNLNINTAPSIDNTLTSVLARNSSGNVVQKQISGYGLFNWEVKVNTNTGGATYNAVSNVGYISDNNHPANPNTFILPLTASVGDVIKVMVADGRARIEANSPLRIVYGVGNTDGGGQIVAPTGFNFGQYESVELIYIGSDRWLLTSFMTLEDIGVNPLINRIY